MSLQLVVKKDIDCVHNLTATTAGTAGCDTLLNVDAPKVGTIGEDTFFTSYKFATADLGLTAGQDISIVCITKTPWAGGSGSNVTFVDIGSASNNRLLLYTWSNVLYWYTKDNTGTSKDRRLALNGTNWAADTEHIVIATADSSNNQQCFLDGTEVTTSSGTGVRESSIATNAFIGANYDDNYPLNAPILVAIFDRVLSPLEIQRITDMKDDMCGWLSPNVIGNLSRLGGYLITSNITPLRGIDELHAIAGNG